jgi:hypothetical protein
METQHGTPGIKQKNSIGVPFRSVSTSVAAAFYSKLL